MKCITSDVELKIIFWVMLLNSNIQNWAGGTAIISYKYERYPPQIVVLAVFTEGFHVFISPHLGVCICSTLK
jgi:hypothetical protein